MGMMRAAGKASDLYYLLESADPSYNNGTISQKSLT